MAYQLAIIVTPKSGKNEIVGMKGDELHVRVTAPPENGKANKAVEKVISDSLGVPKSSISVVRGETSHHKMIAIEGNPALIDLWLKRFK